MLAQSSSSDTITADEVLAVAVFLAFVAALAYAIAKIHTARHRMAWRPVLPLVDGRVESGPSVNTSVMRGTWRGWPVVATALPGTPWGPGSDETAKYNRFILRLFGQAGAGDWKVTIGRHGWRVEAADPALASRLDAAGMARIAADLCLVQDEPQPGISFSARGRHIELNADAGRGIVPTEAELVTLLDALLTIAGINASVNGAAG